MKKVTSNPFLLRILCEIIPFWDKDKLNLIEIFEIY